MRLKAIILSTTLICAPATFQGTAQASEPELVGTFGDWATYSRYDGSARICYVLAKPKSKTPTNVNHGDVYFMVANWQSGAATEQPSLLTGFGMKTNIEPIVRVAGTKIEMYVSQNEAFVEDNSDERRLVTSMRDGSTMRVSATSKRGTNVNYNFSLRGVTAALEKARSACS